MREGDGGRIKKNPECADIGDLSFCLRLAWCVLPLYRFVRTLTHQFTSTHTLFVLEDDPRRPRQETRTPSKEPLTPSHPSPPSSPPALLPQSALPPAPAAYLNQSQRAGAGESHITSAESCESPPHPPGSAPSDFSHTGQGRLRSFIFPPANLQDVQVLQARPPSFDRSRIQAALAQEGMPGHGGSSPCGERGRKADEGRQRRGPEQAEAFDWCRVTGQKPEGA